MNFRDRERRAEAPKLDLLAQVARAVAQYRAPRRAEAAVAILQLDNDLLPGHAL